MSLRINNLIGHNSRGKQRLVINYIGGFTINWPSGSVSTPVNVDLTTEHSSRHVVACYLNEEDYTLNNMSLEGGSFTQQVEERNTDSNISAEIWTKSHPTGLADQSLVLAKSTSINRASRVYIFEVIYVTDANFAFDSGNLSVGDGTQLSWDLPSSPGGVIFGCTSILTTGTPTAWAGLNEIVDEVFSDGRFSVAFKANNFDAGTKAISVTKTSSFPPMVGAILAIS